MKEIKTGPAVVKVRQAVSGGDFVENNILNFSSKEFTVKGDRIINFILEDIGDGELISFKMYLSKNFIESAAGKSLYMDVHGKISYFVHNIEEYHAYESMIRPFRLRKDEDIYYDFLRKLLHYQPTKNSSGFVEQLQTLGCSYDNVLIGNLRGLNSLLDKFHSNVIGVLLSENGGRQYVERDTNTLFPSHGDVPPWYLDKVKELLTQEYKTIRGHVRV